MENLEETTYQEETAVQAEPKRRWLWLVGGIALVLVLGAAAFLAGRLMNRPEQSSGRFGGPAISIRTKGGPIGSEKSYEINIKPAPELPTTEPDANGIFAERKDNSLFIGTGNVAIKVAGGPGAQATAETSYDGPLVEVVVTQDTKIYHDVTELDMENPGSEVQQVLEQGSIEEIGPNSSITVWGKKVGDRIIAEVVFYNQPYLMKSLGGNKP